MKSQAMYVGYRPYERKERILQDGTVIKAAKGVQYLFYCSEWYDGGEIEDMGRTRFMTETEDREPNDKLRDLKLGDLCEVRIRENFGSAADNSCTFIRKIEEGKG